MVTRSRKKIKNRGGAASWISEANLKSGAFRNQLRIPKSKKIPCTFLKSIVSSRIGDKVRNPTDIGVKVITVTRLVKQRAVAALIFKRKTGDCV